jgi:hypothetical protein
MPIVGVLPASGRANRIFGLPKFAIPISEEETLISWHVNKLKEVCDEVIITTRQEWLPILESLDLPAKIIAREPSTLSETLGDLLRGVEGDVIFGMPDTAVIGNSLNPYMNLMKSSGNVTLGLFECTNSLRGKVGQVMLRGETVVDVQDKSPSCNHPLMWGNILFRDKFRNLDLGKNTPSTEINTWILKGIRVDGVLNDGEYVDVGTFPGLKYLLSLL